MDDDLLQKTLARLMRERVKEKPEADEQAKEEEQPVMQQPLIQQSQERSLIQQVNAEVKAELADEELEVKDEIIDADTLQKWCQPVSSSSAADADASNAAASSAADADASKEEPEADEEADGNKEELETKEEGHGEFAQSTHSQPTSQADACKEEPEADEGAVQAHADAPNAAAHADALKAWSLSTPPWRRASPSSVGDQQAASSSGNAQRGSDNADRFLTSDSTDHADRGLKRPSVDESPADLWCAHPQCQEALVSAECSFCIVHCEWRWPTADAPMCKVHWDFPQRCQTPLTSCPKKGPDDESCRYCRTHCPDRDNCVHHRYPARPPNNKTRGKRATARYDSRWSGGGWWPAHPPERPER